MHFVEAVERVRSYGLQMLETPHSNLTAVAVGRKDRGPLRGATDFTVTAFVKNKLTKDQLEAAGVRPFEIVYASAAGMAEPPSVGDVDVVESGTSFSPFIQLTVPTAQRGLFGGNPPTLNAQKWFASLRTGIGITNPVGSYPQLLSVGTAGFYMRDDNGNRYVVSNNHVIGGANNANVGDTVVQPGTLDLTGNELISMPTLPDLEPALGVAELNAIVPLDFKTPTNTPHNHVDAAIALLTDSGRELDDLHRLTYGGAIMGISEPYQLDDVTGAIEGSTKVYKVGRTTGYTEGNVTNVAGVTDIPYNGGIAHFTDQIIVEASADNVGPFSDRGDSGSGVLNDSHELVGLLFAGSTLQTILNPIADVIDALQTASGIASLEVVTA